LAAAFEYVWDGESYSQEGAMLTARVRVVLKLLGSNELAIKRLYETYASKFPSASEFWVRLSGDEEQHAAWLRELCWDESLTTADFAARRFRPDTIRASIKNVEKQIEKAETENITLATALSTARDLENSILESDYFRVLEADSPEMQSVFIRLASETKGHRDAVSEALESDDS
jgi:rubrerythrin